MHEKTLIKGDPFRITAVLCALFAIVGYVLFSGVGTKYVAILCGAVMVWLFLTRDLKPLRLTGVWLLFAFVVFSGFTIIWAVAGKFHLREYTKIFIAATAFIYVALKEEFDRAFVRRVMTIVAGTAAIFALLSIEAVTTGIFKALMLRIPGTSLLPVGFNGGRLSGAFGNSNVEASVFAFGTLFSIALLCGAQSRREKIASSIMLSFNAFAFLLNFSMGSMACFSAAIVGYLIFAGEGRTSALLRMLEGAIPTGVCGIASTVLFNRSDFLGVLPLLLMMLAAVLTAFLELRLSERFDALLYEHRRTAAAALLIVLALLVAYALMGYFITGGYTFGGPLRRSAYPTPGEHMLVIEADGDVTVHIQSESRMQAAMLVYEEVYEGPAADAHFTIPEDSIISYFTFEAAEGTTLRSASIDGTQKIKLNYTLLPSFIANRVQTLRNGQSSVQRDVFREDGFKIWRESPVIGNGVGAFESSEAHVQQFNYQTKYVHEHYIQILLEGGLIGFALWIAALAFVAISLWRCRRFAADWEYAWAYGALWAGYLMAVLVQLWDVSLSYIMVLSYVYTLFGLIYRCCAPEDTAEVSESASAGKRRATKQNNAPDMGARVILCFLPAIFAGTVCGNLFAYHLMHKEVIDSEEFFSNLQLAAKVDIYEKNDAKLSYVMAIMDYDATQHLSQSGIYAADLARTDSYQTIYYLLAYYTSTREYLNAIDMAQKTTLYAVAHPESWTDVADLLRQGFIDNPDSPLLTRPELYVDKLMTYYETFLSYNATTLQPVTLDDATQAVFDKFVAINDCGGDVEQIAAILAD